MYQDTIHKLADAAEAKTAFLQRSRSAYGVASMLAGAYVGMGIALIFVVGAPLASAGSPFQEIIMGGSFGIALTLVILAGSELFTGNTLIMTTGVLLRRVGFGDLCRIWAWSWIGNLLGGCAFAALLFLSGTLRPAAELVEQAALHKMTAPAVQLVANGILCNWLVCLAIWTTFRTNSDAAKCIVIFWCLLAFIACGYEHSVANMSLLTVALLGPHGDGVSWMGMLRNLWWVTLGNVGGGAFLVSGAYVFTSLHGKGKADANA